MRLTTPLILLTLIAASGASAQPPAAEMRGVVVTANDVPLPRVRVTVTGSTATEPAVFTDERGQFAVRMPAASSVRLTFTNASYAATVVDVRPSDPRTADGVRVRLSLGGAISGQIRDRSGNPVIEASVTARRLSPTPASEPAVLSATTNDLGEFRFGGLVAGAYAVGARPAAQFNTPQSGSSPVEEQTVNVSLGAEVSGIDVIVDVVSELVGSAPKRITDPGTVGSLRGRVTSPRGAPVAGAVVQAYRSGAVATGAVETDARGQYVIDQLEPGDYTVLAFKRGYITPRPGEGQSAFEIIARDRSRENRALTVRRGQTADSTDLTLAHGASISGTIVDEFGEPMHDVAVNVHQLRVIGGRPRAFRVAGGRGNLARTDDRGRYRIYGLQPGTYAVQATAGNLLSATTGYVPMFFPGSPNIDLATTVTLDTESSLTGIDIALMPGPTRRVRGTVLDPAGNPTRPQLTLTVSPRSGAIQTEPIRAAANADGTFAFNNIAPGEYIVQAIATDRTGPGAIAAVSRQVARAFVTVTNGDDLPPLRLQLSRGATLMGRVAYEGILEPPRSGIELTAVPIDFEPDPSLASGSIGFALLPERTFEYRGVFGRSVLVVRPQSPDWYVKAITHRGVDLADLPFDFGTSETYRDIEIVVSAAGAVVTGRATDERAAPVRDYTVAVFPTDRAKWSLHSRWLRTSRPSQDGAFRLTGLVPGEYWIAAVDRLDGSEIAGDLQSPDILDALTARATRITLGEGQQQDLTLRLVRR